jgi:hypothetical protein
MSTGVLFGSIHGLDYTAKIEALRFYAANFKNTPGQERPGGICLWQSTLLTAHGRKHLLPNCRWCSTS